MDVVVNVGLLIIQVEPSSAQEKANMLDSVEKVIVDIKGQRCEDLVVNMTRRNREEYESELKFKVIFELHWNQFLIN